MSREGKVVAHECDEVCNVVTREDLVGIVAVGAFGKDGGGVLCRGICRVEVSWGESRLRVGFWRVGIWRGGIVPDACAEPCYHVGNCA